MALRKHLNQGASELPSGSQPTEDGGDNDELSSSLLLAPPSRPKHRRENKSKEMTEEEMMDLALRLSEQEASITALKLQKEEEAVMKAIQESMANQTQPCPPSQSLSALADADASLRICPRRKLMHSNGKPASVISQGASEGGSTPETDLHRGTKGSGEESRNANKKRKRKAGSPLLEMPDSPQTQTMDSQASPCSSESLCVALDSPQSSDSTQIDDCQLRKSPVFPSTGCRAAVHVPRLSQDLLQTCRTSGFVLCSQDSWTSPQKSLPAQPRSPTFPKSPGNPTLSKSPVSSETDQGDDKETEPSPECFKSPVFGGNAQQERSSPSAYNSGFMSSSQESLWSSVRSTSKSPVFPRSPGLPENPPPAEREPDSGQAEQNDGRSISPVFGQTGQRQNISASPSAAALRAAAGDGGPSSTRGPPGSPRQDSSTDSNQDVGLNKSSRSDDAEELKETSKALPSDETELTSDMTLLWSDEDDVTPGASSSPVFPEERSVRQADGRVASLDHVTAASAGMNGSDCRPSSSSSSTRRQLSTTEPEPQPISSQDPVSRAPAAPEEPAGGATVHYYWGVPFCPRGLDPDTYTQVILAQMEVYEKSLKRAQRGLLRKAEWGEAVLPETSPPSPESPTESPQQHVPHSRGLRLRGKILREASDTAAAEEEEEREDKEEKKNEADGQVDTDCEVCPETQLSDDDRTQDLMMAADAGAEHQPKGPELSEVEMLLPDDSPAGGEPPPQDEDMEVDAPVDRKTKGTNIPVSSSNGQHVRKEEDGRDPDVEEIKDRVLQRSTSAELEPAAVPQSPETNVDCPICQGSFSLTEIELHAAYCDGEVAVVEERRPKAGCFQVSLKPRRKRARRAEEPAEDTNSSNTGKSQEKCYICQKAVPLRDYSRHTELCIQRQASKTAATFQKGSLLSALDQTENRDSEAGPSGSKLQPGDVIDLRDDDDDEEDGSVLQISNSPIRSFTPISEASGCLVDFKKQQRVKKLSQRRR